MTAIYNESLRAVYADAAEKGNFEIVRQAMEDDVVGDYVTIIAQKAAKKGHLSIVQLAMSHLFWSRNAEPSVCAQAASGNQLHVLQWAHRTGILWDESTCANAAREGHFELLQWAHENGAPLDASTCAMAARSGHLKVLKWARKNRAPWDISTCSEAARCGHFKVLKWAHRNGAPWDGLVCAEAVKRGDLDMLAWALSKGAPFDKDKLRMVYAGCPKPTPEKLHASLVQHTWNKWLHRQKLDSFLKKVIL